MCFRHLHHRVSNRTGLCTFHRVTEQPVLAADRKRPDGIFAEVIGEAAASVFQISHGCFPAVLHIGQRLIQTGVTGGMLAVDPRPKGLENRLFLLKTHLPSVFMIRPTLTGNGVFQSCQAVTVVDTLYCRLIIIQLFPFRNGIHEVSADVCPAATAFYAGHFIVALVAIRFQISLKAIQEVCCIVSASCRSVLYPYKRMAGSPSSPVRNSHMNDWLSALRPGSLRTCTRVSSAMRNPLCRS